MAVAVKRKQMDLKKIMFHLCHVHRMGTLQGVVKALQQFIIIGQLIY